MAAVTAAYGAMVALTAVGTLLFLAHLALAFLLNMLAMVGLW